jgi:hypothetical protein
LGLLSEVKRYAVILISISLLWFFGISIQPDNLYDDFYADHPAFGQAVRIFTPLAFLCLPVAGWLLSTACHPDSNWKDKVKVTVFTSFAGTAAALLLMFCGAKLSDYLWPLS